MPKHILVVVRLDEHEPAPEQSRVYLGRDVTEVGADRAHPAVLGGYPVAAGVYRVVRCIEARHLIARAGYGLADDVDEVRIPRDLVGIAQPLERALGAVYGHTRLLGQELQPADMVTVLVGYEYRLNSRERDIIELESGGEPAEADAAVDENAAIFGAYER